MGQRTKMLIELTSLDGKVEYRYFHNQWGFGKIMPLTLIAIISGMAYSDKSNFFESLRMPSKWSDITDRLDSEDVSISSGEKLNELFGWSDNNDGGLVLRVKLLKDGYILQPSYSYAMVTSDGALVSADEYMKGYMNYYSAEFSALFDQFCSYFDVECYATK